MDNTDKLPRYEMLSNQLEERLGRKEAIAHGARLAGYREVPPTFDEFITDTDFAGGEGGIGESLYPIWKDVLRQVFPHPLWSDYSEVIMTGSIGAGKSTLCLVGMMYDVCKLLYLTNPHKRFQLMPSTPIVIAFINATKSLSQSVLVDQFYSMCRSSKFFEEEMKRAVRMYGRRAGVFLPNRITILGGSRGGDSYGRGVVMALLSELNFQGAAVKDQAVNNYVHTSRRIQSRFGRGEGVFAPGRLWLDSSRKDETGFLENYMKSIGDREDILTVSKAIWEVQKSSGKFSFSGEDFNVFIGTHNRQPFIIDKPGASLGIPEELIIPVPIEFLVHFQMDIFGALRDLAGLATWSGHRFISNDSLIDEQCQLPNPVTKTVIDLDFDNREDQIINYMLSKRDVIDGIEVDPMTKKFPIYVHFDLAKGKEGGDLAGIAITAAVAETMVRKAGPQLIGHPLESDLMYQTLAVLAVRAKTGQELILGRFRQFILDLTQRGYNVAGVSADGYQSGDLITFCQESGIPSVKVLSLDSKRDGYDHLKECMIERRWSGPKHPILIKEFKALQDLGKKIDHPEDTGLTKERSSKDLADCVAGSVYHCKESSKGFSAIKAQNAFSAQLAAMAAKKPEGLKEQMKQQGLKQRSRGWGKGRFR